MSTYKITEEELREIESITSKPHEEWDWELIYGGYEMEDYKLHNPEKKIIKEEERDWEPMDWEADVDTLDMPPEVAREIYENLIEDEEEWEADFDEFEEMQDYFDEQEIQEKYARRTKFNTRKPNGPKIDWFGEWE